MAYLLEYAQVSKSGYYRWLRHKDDKFLKDKPDYDMIKDICNAKKHRVGIRTISMILRNQYGIIMNIKKINRIKKLYDIRTEIRKKNPHNIMFKKGLEHRTSPNVLDRHFRVDEVDKVYSTDVSYLIYKGGKKAYLSAVKDLASKEIVGFNISPFLGLDAVYNKMSELLENKQGLIIHSDQGFHYTHPIYVNMLKKHGVTQSMSRKGNCLDNAPIESFLGHMKDEINLKECASFEEVKKLVANYINYYNNERYQWGLNKMTPVVYRRHLLELPL
jgi:transposase InsO family protein